MAKRKSYASQQRGREIDFRSIVKSNLLQAIIYDFAIGLSKDEIVKKYNMRRNDADKFKRLYLKDITMLRAKLEAKPKSQSAFTEVQEWEVDPVTGKTYQQLSEEFTIVGTAMTEPEQTPEEKSVEHEPEIHFVGEVDWKSKKITPDMARQILSDLGEHVLTQTELAKMYEVSPSTISSIKNGKGQFQIVDVVKEPDPEPVVMLAKTTELVIEQPDIEQTITEASLDLEPESVIGEDTAEEQSQQQHEENICRIDDGKLIAIPIVDTIEDQSKIETEIVSESVLSQRVPVTQYIICGMIDGRHPLPVKQYIFSSVNDDLLKNYEEQYLIARHRIEELVENYNDNSRSKGLCMYITGLASVQATIIKVCLDLELNLTLMHFDPKTGGYNAQELITTFGNNNPCPSELFTFRCGQLYSYECQANQLHELGQGFMVLEYVIDPTDDKDWMSFINTGYDSEKVKYELRSEILSNGQVVIPGGFPKTATFCVSNQKAERVFDALATNENANVFLVVVELNHYNHGIIFKRTLKKQININWM